MCAHVTSAPLTCAWKREGVEQVTVKKHEKMSNKSLGEVWRGEWGRGRREWEGGGGGGGSSCHLHYTQLSCWLLMSGVLTVTISRVCSVGGARRL